MKVIRKMGDLQQFFTIRKVVLFCWNKWSSVNLKIKQSKGIFLKLFLSIDCKMRDQFIFYYLYGLEPQSNRNPTNIIRTLVTCPNLLHLK